MEKTFTKLSSLVNDQFTVERVGGYKYKCWDVESGRMLVQDEWAKGFRKVYQVDTDKGTLDLSFNQLGILLESVQHAGQSNIIGASFSVKSNGKTGMEIRYYLNPARVKAEELPEEPVGF